MAIHGIWDRLTGSEQGAIATDIAALHGTDEWPDFMEGWMTQALNMRRGDIRRLDPQDLADAVVRMVPRIDADSLRTLLVHVHMHARQDLLLAVYGALGVESPCIDLSESQGETQLDPARAAVEIPKLLAEHEPGRLSFCLDLMEVVTFEPWQPAVQAGAEALRRALPEESPPAEDLEHVAETPDELEATADAPDSLGTRPRFSGLDRLMIRTIVSAANETTGAPSVEEASRLVHELVQLNDQRPRSWFHAGFLDALTEEPCAKHSRGENRDRRAWYLTGWFLGRMRTASAVAIMIAESRLDDRDREVLLAGGGHAAGQMLAPHVVEAALEADQVATALAWLGAYLEPCAPRVIPVALSWSVSALRRELTAEITDVLGLIWRRLPALRAEEPDFPAELLVSVGRRYGIALRSEGRMAEAEAVVEESLKASGDDHRPNLLADLALARMGVGTVATIDVPSGETRDGFLQTIESSRELLQEAAGGASPSPIAKWVLAMPIVADSDAPEADVGRAIAALRGVVEAMVQPGAAGYWRDSGAVDRVRWHLAVLELRTGDPSLAQPAVARLQGALKGGIVPPLDLLCEAIAQAAMLDVKGVAQLGRAALGTDVAKVLASLDLLAVCKRSSAFRDGLLKALAEHAPELRPVEAWEAWKALALGALEGTPRDVEMAVVAFDQLDRLAHEQGCAELMLTLLDSQERLEPAWDAEACSEVRVRLLLGLGRTSDARAALCILANEAITRGDADSEDLIEKLEGLGGSPEEVDPLVARLLERVGEQTPEVVPDAQAPISQSRMRILFVGGHETQQAYKAGVEAALADGYPNATLDYRNPGWGSNWGRLLRRLRGSLEQADAIVIMRFVRTNMGRSLRRLASEQDKPWIPCTGHGKASIERSILRAAHVVCELAAESPA